MAFADEPPSWTNYKVVSKNGDYFAWVQSSNEDSLKKPWECDWTLTVYNKIENDSVQIWKSKYAPNGYKSGKISDDGQFFAEVDKWFNEYDIITIYNKTGPICIFSGKELNIPKTELLETRSHHIWMKYYFFIDDGKSLEIVTFFGKRHVIDLMNCNRVVNLIGE